MFSRLLHRAPFAHQLAWDTADTLRRLQQDHDYVVTYWRLYRTRQPLLDCFTLSTDALPLSELASLSPDVIRCFHRFETRYQKLFLWAQTTEEMPLTFSEHLFSQVKLLQGPATALVTALGSPPLPPDPAEPPWRWRTLRRDS